MSASVSTASSPLSAIVLAAGQGTRMRSGKAKVLHKILGRTMVDCSLSLLAPLGVQKTALVLGHQAADVEAAVRASGIAVQPCMGVVLPPDYKVVHPVDVDVRLRVSHRRR